MTDGLAPFSPLHASRRPPVSYAAIERRRGKPVKHVDVPAEAAKQAMLRNGMPTWLVDGLLAVHARTKGGATAFVSQAFEQVTGRKGRTVEAWFAENAAAFK